MDTLIKNGAPQYKTTGAKDTTASSVDTGSPTYPVNTPHLFIYAERGRKDPLILSLDQAKKEYGDATFSERSVYFNHQTVFATEAFGPEANKMMFQRLEPDDAPAPATLVIWADVLQADLPNYQREADGSYTYVDGELVDLGTTTAGVKIKWSVTGLDRAGGETITGLTSKPGLLAGTLDGSPTTSTLYPIMVLEVMTFGAYGSNQGIRLYGPTLKTTIPVDEDLIEDQGAYLYRIQMIEKQTTSTTPVVTETPTGDRYVEFMFKSGAYNNKYKKDLFIDSVLPAAYKSSTLYTDDYPDVSPFGVVHTYHDYMATILGLAYAAEAAEGTMVLPTGTGAEYIMNLFGGTDYNEIPYYAVQVAGIAEDGAIFTDSTAHYATGGGDGTMSDLAFAALVKHQLDNYGELDYKFADTARYPQTSYWETGFPVDTKYSFYNVLSVRTNCQVFSCTQDVMEDLNTQSEDASIAVTLSTRALAVPESTIFGTPCCRAAIFAGAGKLLSSAYTKTVPLLLEFARMYARYLGSEVPTFNEAKAYDTKKGKKLTLIDPATTNVETMSDALRNQNWANGVVWAQYYDRNQLAFLQFQTVYPDDTSALNTINTATALCVIDTVCRRVHMDMSGTTRFETDLEFLEEADRLTTAELVKILPSRFTWSVESYKTADDEELGYSWHTNVYLGANRQKTVNVQTTIVHRKDTGV